MESNTIFVGRDNYTGPDSGILGLCHHNRLFESSHSFKERVMVINRDKPARERAIRLHNLIYIDLAAVPGISKETSARWQEADARWEEAYASWQEAAASWQEAAARWQEAYARRQEADAEIAPQILAYIRSQIPDCAWNGTELVFPND